MDLARKVALSVAQPGHRVLDIGCARGDFLIEMRDRGWTVAGVEPSASLAAQAKSAGLPVWPASLDEAEIPPEAFDVVTAWDVVEHLADPVQGLRRIHAALRPGGRLILNTPVLDGWDARLFGSRWSGWDPPRHHVVFTERTLRETLRLAGFEVGESARVFETYLITALSLSLLATDILPARAAALTTRLLHLRPVRWMMAPIWAALDRAFGTSSRTLVAVKAA